MSDVNSVNNSKATSASTGKDAVVKSPNQQQQQTTHYTGKTVKGTASATPGKLNESGSSGSNQTSGAQLLQAIAQKVAEADAKQKASSDDRASEAAPKSSPFSVRMKIVQDFPDLPYTLQALIVNGKDNGQRSIWEGERHLADVRKGYSIIPNEYVLKVADQIAREEGAVPFHEFGGQWFMKAEKHVLYGGFTGHQMHALYTWNEDFEVRKGDKIQLGFSIHNSIDGRMGLGGGFFTFRHACENMFFMGFKAQGMNGFDDRETLAHFYRKHTREIQPELVRKLMQRAIAEGKNIAAEIRAMDERKLTLEKAVKLVDVIGVDRAIEVMPYLDIPSEDEKDGKIKLVDDTITEYEAWNDVTYAITHADELATFTKMGKFREVETTLVRPRAQKAPKRIFTPASKKVVA